MTRTTTSLALFASAVLLSSCGILSKKTKSTPTIGDRVAVLVSEVDIEVDPETAAAPMTLPTATANADWAQSGGNAAKLVEHVALGATVGQAWSASIGEGSSRSRRLGGGPVVAGGKVYTIDTVGSVRAFDATSGAPLWVTRFGDAKGNENTLYGGGVAVDGGRVYATNGFGYVAALDAATGAAAWTVRPGGPIRGAPTVADGNVYVISQDNQIFSLKTADGSTAWSNAAALEVAGVFGNGSPAVDRGTVVAGFSSGELNAYRVENGRMVWQDALSRTSISTGVGALSDIDADPVIANGMIYALGQGGRMVALDLASGQRVWELNMAGIATPWIAGDWLFAVNDKSQLIAVQRMTGKIRWINQLPRWTKESNKSGQISYFGPVLAGGRLIVAGSNGALINIDPTTGVTQGQTSVGGAVRFQPVVAGGSLYLLTDEGRLIAYR
ncbi:MAG: PQQ-binding-like beta-propeller repeat protein [Pseudomonadota bacterium]|nr:PQQ-binding-like beta-propeller repeat protein [Pseudomonadota bacterium]